MNIWRHRTLFNAKTDRWKLTKPNPATLQSLGHSSARTDDRRRIRVGYTNAHTTTGDVLSSHRNAAIGMGFCHKWELYRCKDHRFLSTYSRARAGGHAQSSFRQYSCPSNRMQLLRVQYGLPFTPEVPSNHSRSVRFLRRYSNLPERRTASGCGTFL